MISFYIQMELPKSFIERIQQLLGEGESQALLQSLEVTSPVSVRRNPLKPSSVDSAEIQVPWSSEGYYLSQRPRFTYDPLFHAGCYYVQEASSMFIEQAFRCMETLPKRVLDLCAAPGGKSTLWRSLLPDGALLVANEPISARSWVLAENLTKWGHPDVVVTQAYPADFAPLTGFFDVVSADVPCSGEGMFRKDEGARQEWSEENVMMCAERQWQIISDIWPTLREGGYLVYSTCTFNREENEDNVARICRELGAECIEIPVSSEWHISGDTTGRGLPVYHFFPHRTRGEGFFLALLRKTSEQTVRKEKKRKHEQREQSVAGGAAVAQWLQRQQEFKIFRPDECHIGAVRQSLYDDVRRISQMVRTLMAGILMAEEKGRKLIPQQALALSVECAPNAFARVELNYEQAIAYLRHEALQLPNDAPRGYVIVTYASHPLGFVNNLGNRANNLYPAEWRIRN